MDYRSGAQNTLRQRLPGPERQRLPGQHNYTSSDLPGPLNVSFGLHYRGMPTSGDAANN